MAQVITFLAFRPIERYDATPWISARIEEAATADAAEVDWTAIETITLSPVDADPAEPVYRNLTTELASDDADLWYRIVFVDATGDESLPTTPIQNTSSEVGLYATVTELARILKIRTPSDEQTSAMERVLLAAAGEINAEIDLDADTSLSGWQVALAEQVNLARAAELWKLEEVQFGVVMGGEFGAVHLARNSWDKHAFTLAPLKQQWGLA